ncbi:hypothetical protein Ancab_023533 [Ancistrocladus abbreviatus]
MGCLPGIKLIPINEMRVKGLESADIIAGYVIKLLIVYLTIPESIGLGWEKASPADVTTLSYARAAAYVNVFWGVVYILPIVLSRIQMASPKAEFHLLCYSNALYCAGLGLLFKSSSKEGMKKPAAFYASLLFLAIGIAGQSTTRESFEKKQKAASYLVCGMFTRCLLQVIAFLGVQMAGTMIDLIPSWRIKYSYDEVHGSLLESIFNLVKALFSIAVAIIKCLCTTLIKICVPSCIRNMLPSCLSGGEEDESSRRSEAEKRKDAEITLHLIPMFMTFIMCGVVCSTAYTTLLVQAASMKHSTFLAFLLFFYSVGKATGTLCTNIVNCSVCLQDIWKTKQRFAPTFGIGLAMFFSILTTITAAKVEARRQKNPGLLSMWWLLPQSVFVGVLDGIYQVSINNFFVNGLSSTRKKDIPIFAKAVFGAGFIGNVVLVYILSKTTQWMPKDDPGLGISGSQLDKYYWLLAILSCINLAIYVLIAIWFNHKYDVTTSSSSPSTHDQLMQAIEHVKPEQRTNVDGERAALNPSYCWPLTCLSNCCCYR